MDTEIYIYITLAIGFICAGLTVQSSQIAKKNNYQHRSKTSLYIHLASTFSMYALLAWGIIEVAWWVPLVIAAFTYQLAGLVVKLTNWQAYFNAIPVTGGLTTTITISAWTFWVISKYH